MSMSMYLWHAASQFSIPCNKKLPMKSLQVYAISYCQKCGNHGMRSQHLKLFTRAPCIIYQLAIRDFAFSGSCMPAFLQQTKNLYLELNFSSFEATFLKELQLKIVFAHLPQKFQSVETMNDLMQTIKLVMCSAFSFQSKDQVYIVRGTVRCLLNIKLLSLFLLI